MAPKRTARLPSGGSSRKRPKDPDDDGPKKAKQAKAKQAKAKQSKAKQAKASPRESSEDPSEESMSAIGNGLDRSLAPISNIDAAFYDMVRRIPELPKSGARMFLRTATMCSGTEAPIFVLMIFRDEFERMFPGMNFLDFEHVFSVEVVPYKQSYIARNMEGTILFNDLLDFADPKNKKAPTAMGAMEEIPGQIDLLVAGCCCVDFSALNSRQAKDYSPAELKQQYQIIPQLAEDIGYTKEYFEQIDDFFNKCLKIVHSMGSSGSTFISMLSYVRTYRPKVVILENVQQAPWKETEKVWFPFLGYTAFFIKLDTKDFYIPQTRNRGYLIALDRKVFGDMAEEIGKDWNELLKITLPRRASAPINDWLLPAAHPLTERARQDDSEKALGPAVDPEWARAKAIHVRTRKNEGLGLSRPITQWDVKNGQPYDRMDRSVTRSQANRVLDCIEINHLRAETKGLPIRGVYYTFDSKFKNRINDLSQNIDRSAGGGPPFGMTGCLTPNGIHFMPDQSRMVTGYEALALQGLPLHRLEFATETQEQLRDLAGNAMSTTVVGAVMLALFEAINRNGELNVYFPRPPLLKKEQEVRLIGDSHLERVQGFTTMDAQPIHTSITALFHRSRRYCFCNGSAKYSTDDFKKCTKCLTIRCRWCAGNPPHSFVNTQRPSDYLLLSEVEQEVMRILPGTIGILIDTNLEPPYFELGFTVADVPEILLKLRDVTFYYESTRVTEEVTVCYSGQWGFDLRAVLSEKGITWYLYLDAWHDTGLAFRDGLDKLTPPLGNKYIQLPQPIAKAAVPEYSQSALPEPNAWQLWCFKTVPIEVDIIRTADSLNIAGGRLIDPQQSPSDINLDYVLGEYHHCPDCDAPEHSLHVHKAKKLFLFKDVSRITTPDEDGYVISESCRQLESHEYREVLVRFDTSLNILKTGTSTIKAYTYGYWVVPQRENIAEPANGKPWFIRAKERLNILDSKQFTVVAEDPGQQVLVEAEIVREKVCDKYEIMKKYKSLCRGGDGWAFVKKVDLHHIHNFISHLNVKLAGIEGLEVNFEIAEVEAWLKELDNWKNALAGARKPRECPYGQLPPLRWVKFGRNKHIGHHLSDAIADFEKRNKSRIPIFEPRVRVLPSADPDGKMHALVVQYLINHKALGQKAAAYLPPSKDPEARVTANVRVERNAILSLNVQVDSRGNSRHKFEPFRNAIRNLEGFPAAKEPALASFKGELSESQLRSLSWMLERERGNPKFKEQETEEEIVPELKLRLVGSAERIIRNHGGVLADDVGYGKTVVTLALMHCQQVFDNERSFKRRNADKPSSTYLKATLVVVPKHLVDQWIAQALQFLPIKPKEIVKIAKDSDFNDTDWNILRRLRRARLIVVSVVVFESTRYHERLAQLAGDLDPPALPTSRVGESNCTRCFEDWYKDAAPAAREHMRTLFSLSEQKPMDIASLKYLYDKIHGRLEHLMNEYQVYAKDLILHDSARRHNGQEAAEEESDEDQENAPAKGGGKKGKGKKSSARDEDREAIQLKPSATNYFPSLTELEAELCKGQFVHILDAFTFARVVYDEFSYTNFAAMTFFANSDTHAKWILSATPPTRNLAAVHGIANLINVHLVRPIYLRQGMPRITKGPVLSEMTNAEVLQNRKFMSDLCIRERHEKGIEFLQCFATSNPLDVVLAGGIVVEEKVVVCEMSTYEFIHYKDLEHDVRACGLDAGMLPRESRSLIQPLIDTQRWSEDGKTVAMEALLSRSSQGNWNKDVQSLEGLLEQRRQQNHRAKSTFRIIAEKAIWLASRVTNNEAESRYENANRATGDICMRLRDIMSRDLESCGGIDAWQYAFEALGVGKYADVLRSLQIQCPEFREDDRGFLSFLNGVRSSSWNDYYDLKYSDVNGMEEGEADDLVDDLINAYGVMSIRPAVVAEPKKAMLTAIFKDKQGGLERLRRTPGEEVPRPKTNNLESLGRPTKGACVSQLKSIGILFHPQERRDVLAARLLAHKNGTLDNSEYVGFNNSQMVKRVRYPRFGETFKVRGGTYTNTRSDTSDTSLQLRDAQEQLLYTLKQLRIAENLISSDKKLRCDGCAQLKPKEDLYLVCECGHLLCADHLASDSCGQTEPSRPSYCPSLLKDATMKLSQVNSPQRYIDLDTMERREAPCPQISAKSQMIANCINATPADDRVVLFVQFHRQSEELQHALRMNGIASTISATEQADKKVRILRLNDPASAGTNLQYANHVMFACPLLVNLQEDYDAFMKQAKGRCIRYGQEKVVHVYHFVTANTIEVDILELRRQNQILVRPGEAFGRFVNVPPTKENATSKKASSDNGDIVMFDDYDREERVTSILTSNEIWKAMNEANWLNTVGVEY
ncbi:hypothetical protein F4804DRAFT_350865 [Jackrogersella minutella]|nr:hypothetical protein F4804DRAFT_350865 [Jackrogersella minutella]